MTIQIYLDGTWPDLYPLTLTSPTARPVSSTASFTDLLHNASGMTKYTAQQENYRTDGDHLCSKVHLSRTEPDRPSGVVHRVFH